MRIISKFKDYYDGGAVYGIDKERIYIRETQVIEKIDYDLNLFSVIGFCGEIYPFVSVAKKSYFSGDEWELHPKDYTLYCQDAINLEFESYVDKFAPYQNKDKWKIVERKKDFYYTKHGFTKLQEIYDNIRKNSEILSLFLKFKTPIFSITQSTKSIRATTLTINPNLKDVAFYKIKDTIQAFQEIEMYISNVLVSDTIVNCRK
jgi:hypothetical protein